MSNEQVVQRSQDDYSDGNEVPKQGGKRGRQDGERLLSGRWRRLLKEGKEGEEPCFYLSSPS